MNINSINRCTIIGGGFAGLLSAIYLSRKNIEVNIIDKRLFDQIEFRFISKLSQQEHVHILTREGTDQLFELFPDFKEKFGSHKFPELNFTSDIKWNGPQGSFPQFKSDFGNVYTFSRKSLENFLLDEIKKLNNIKIIANTEFIKPLTCEERVHSLELYDKINKNYYEIESDLHLICTGRNFKFIPILNALGIKDFKQEFVPSNLFYRSFKIKTNYFQTKKTKAIMTTTFGNKVPNGSVLYPIANNEYIVTQVSRKFIDNIYDFSLKLHDREIYNVLKSAENIGKEYIYKIRGSKRIKINKIKKWPKNLLSLGDSMISLNPIFGQGLSLSIVHLKKLDQWLETSENELEYQKSLMQISDRAWKLGTIEDKRMNATGLKKVFYSIGEKYILFLINRAKTNRIVYMNLISLLNMKTSASSFIFPINALRDIRN